MVLGLSLLLSSQFLNPMISNRWLVVKLQAASRCFLSIQMMTNVILLLQGYIIYFKSEIPRSSKEMLWYAGGATRIDNPINTSFFGVTMIREHLRHTTRPLWGRVAIWRLNCIDFIMVNSIRMLSSLHEQSNQWMLHLNFPTLIDYWAQPMVYDLIIPN